MVFILAVGAALMLGVGSAIQQRVAFRAPDGLALHVGLLWHLVRQRLWLLGLATTLLGGLLSGAALGKGSVVLVQPVLVLRLLFALSTAAIWSRRPLRPRDWATALAVTGGMVAFLVAGAPGTGNPEGVQDWEWAAPAFAIGTLTLLLVHVARRLRPNQEAPMLALGAGMLYGLQSALTQSAVHRLSTHGLLGLVTSWQPYAVFVIGLVGTLLAQSAFDLAPLSVSYPPLAVAEPLAGIAIGIGVLGGTLRFTPATFAVEAAGLIVMTLAVYLLASSPHIVGHHDEPSKEGADESG
ncbi:DMT family transporter [Micromonospora sp. SL4-19]|uniref:DMT family transporter n=1 Tax=Micromonospora sp. SL4-19 TaxID=3399129 RepID=UPI003A4E2D0E